MGGNKRNLLRATATALRAAFPAGAEQQEESQATSRNKAPEEETQKAICVKERCSSLGLARSYSLLRVTYY